MQCMHSVYTWYTLYNVYTWYTLYTVYSVQCVFERNNIEYTLYSVHSVYSTVHSVSSGKNNIDEKNQFQYFLYTVYSVQLRETILNTLVHSAQCSEQYEQWEKQY